MSLHTILAIEAGGTTFKLSHMRTTSTHLNASELPLDETHIIPTTTPHETMQKIKLYCDELLKDYGEISSVGIACFGPIQLDRNKPNYGYITSTPKEQWRNFDIVAAVREITQCDDIGFDTDVNAPAFVESTLIGLKNVAYVTIGTGIGVGVVVNGHTVHGLVHPEGGHMYAPLAEGDNFHGVCPFHKICVEGMANSNAIRERCNLQNLSELENLTDENPVWDFVAHYLAHLCLNVLLITSAERIVLGGGVMERKCLFPKIRDRFTQYLNGYVRSDILENNMKEYICEPLCGSRVGIAGAYALAFHELQ